MPRSSPSCVKSYRVAAAAGSVAVDARAVERASRPVAVQSGDVAEPRLGPSTERLRHGGEEATGVGRHRPHGGLRDEQRAADQHHHEHHRGTHRADQRFERDRDQGAEPSARRLEEVDIGGELVGTTEDLEQAERRCGDHRPTDAEPERARRSAPANERHADRGKHHRQRVPAEAGEPAEQRLDASPEGAGEIEVHRQPEEDRRSDQAQAEELVLAAGDRFAHLDVRPGAARCLLIRWGGVADRSGRARRPRSARPGPGRPGLGRRGLGRLGRCGRRRALLGRSPGGHGCSTVPIGGGLWPVPRARQRARRSADAASRLVRAVRRSGSPRSGRRRCRASPRRRIGRRRHSGLRRPVPLRR